MIKTILVPATGNERDEGVFGSALAVAHPFAAHLDSCIFVLMPRRSRPRSRRR
jgi:hypothetical protein